MTRKVTSTSTQVMYVPSNKTSSAPISPITDGDNSHFTTSDGMSGHYIDVTEESERENFTIVPLNAPKKYKTVYIKKKIIRRNCSMSGEDEEIEISDVNFGDDEWYSTDENLKNFKKVSIMKVK